MKASSEKFTTKASSCGFEASIRSSALLFTAGRFFDIEPELSTTSADRNRQIGVLKADDVLLHAVFENLKVLLASASAPTAVAFQHRGIQHHLFHVGAQNVSFAPSLCRGPPFALGGCSASGERTGSRSTVSEWQPAPALGAVFDACCAPSGESRKGGVPQGSRYCKGA